MKLPRKLSATLASALTGACLVLSTPAANAQSTGYRDILLIGCYKSTDICFVNISGTKVGPDTCYSTSVRWDPSTKYGREALAVLTAASLAGTQVNFRISGCSPRQTTYPTFIYYYIKGQ